MIIPFDQAQYRTSTMVFLMKWSILTCDDHDAFVVVMIELTHSYAHYA